MKHCKMSRDGNLIEETVGPCSWPCSVLQGRYTQPPAPLPNLPGPLSSLQGIFSEYLELCFGSAISNVSPSQRQTDEVVVSSVQNCGHMNLGTGAWVYHKCFHVNPCSSFSWCAPKWAVPQSHGPCVFQAPPIHSSPQCS